MRDVAFRNTERANLNTARIRERISPGLLSLLPTLLVESPDPDSALNLFERLCTEGSQDAVRLMARQPFLLHYTLTVFGYSQYLGESLIQNPDLFHMFAREKTLDLSLTREEFSERLARLKSRSLETDMATLLARFKKREYVRILLRDVLNIADLAEVTAEISALADVLIEEALHSSDAALRNRYGAPGHAGPQGRIVKSAFSVLSLGKLGGNELNYSSDVDLLFLFADGESALAASQDGSPAANREYFIRLAQQITEMLSRPTREGPVFRMDLRLRPQGQEGQAAVSVGHALHYYQEAAHDWELQALIKARHSAGDATLSREFIRGVQPRVYRRGLNFAAIETSLLSLQKISSFRRRQRGAAESTIDVKLDRGGIRDIEFLVQCLQRVYGGEEPWLRSGGTLFALQKLHDKNHISGRDFDELNGSYEFLRTIEHRVQLQFGQQTHRLPSEKHALEILTRSLGEVQAAGPARPDLPAVVQQRMKDVEQIYKRLIHAQRFMRPQEPGEAEFYLRPPRGAEPGRESFDHILSRLGADCPRLKDVASQGDLSSHTKRNLHRFLGSALTSSERYAAVVRAPEALERAFIIFETSDYLSEILIRHPEEIETIDEVSTQAGGEEEQKELALPATELESIRDATFEHIAAQKSSYAVKLAGLREHYRHRVFAVGVGDVVSCRPVFDSLFLTSSIARDAIAAALSIARLHLDQKETEFAVFALGRLGTSEFDVASDADLLFVRGDDQEPAQATRLAEQVVDILSAYTQQGMAFPVDTRLRPLGADGDLVTTPAAMRFYFGDKGDGKAWEALSFTKLQFLAGSPALEEVVSAVLARGMQRFAHSPSFLAEVSQMRAKLAGAEASDANTKVDFKRCEGGFYDIDFVASWLLVRNWDSPDLQGAAARNIRQRLHALAAANFLTDADCATLDYSAEFLRTLDHVIRLVMGRARNSVPPVDRSREMVEQLAGRILRREFPNGLEADLQRIYPQVREVFHRVLT